MHLQESGEMYLESIFVLTQKLGAVRSIDVSEYMGYSKPSVSRAVGILKKAGYVTVSDEGFLSLTEEGKAIAQKINERHTVLTKMLTMLGVDEHTAAEDACKMEHAISDISFAKIKEYLENF